MILRGLIAFATVLIAVTADQDMYCDVADEQLYVYRVPKHSCKCNKGSEGTLRYFNKKLQICNGEVFVDVGGGLAPTLAPTAPPTTKPTTLKPTTPKPTTPKPTTPKPTNPPPIGDKENPGIACHEIRSKRSDARDGYYYLKNGATVTKTYCYMGHICGSRGWTMIMKINGRSNTFNYDSHQWRTRSTYNPNGASSGLGQQETKLESYWTYPFRRLCLGMRVDRGSLHWLTVNYNARSLYDVIAPGGYRSFHVGRHSWKNLVPGSSLQPHCNREGFNVQGRHRHSKARIGIISNQENECQHPDSRIGFGTGGGACGENSHNSAGNEARCSSDNGDKSIFGFGYIFAQ